MAAAEWTRPAAAEAQARHATGHLLGSLTWPPDMDLDKLATCAQSNAATGSSNPGTAIPGSGASAQSSTDAAAAPAAPAAPAIQPAAPGYTGRSSPGAASRGIFGILGLAAEATVSRPIGGNAAPASGAPDESVIDPLLRLPGKLSLKDPASSDCLGSPQKPMYTPASACDNVCQPTGSFSNNGCQVPAHA